MKFICALFLTLLCMQTVNAGDSNPIAISEINWSHDGSKIAVGYRNGTFRIFRSSDMTILFEQLTTDTGITSLAWSPSGTKLAIGYYLDRVDIWDVVSFQKTLTLFTGSSHNSRLMWGEDDDTLFVSDGADIPTVEFDANTGIVLETYTVIYSNIRLLHIRDISVNHWRSRLFFVDLNNMTVIDEFNFDSQLGRIVSVQVSPDEDLIAIGFVDNTIHILDIQSREIIAVLDGGQETEGQFGISDLAFNKTGSRLFTVTQSGTIRSWDTATWQMID
ncbi:MAG TPA: WD40 repeat domain-containing protein, partial [Aggregatilineales bacterium]|nr:WD40 repeat domain-containing protein [Aggregatilineales bacterium]